MLSLLWTFCVFSFCASQNVLETPLKILVYSPRFGGSHSKFMGSLADALTDAGHSVTYLVPIADIYSEHHIGVHRTKDVVIVENDKKMKKQNSSLDQSTRYVWELELDKPNYYEVFKPFIRMMVDSCSNLVRNKDIVERMAAKKFDVAITEPLFACGLGFFEKIEVKRTILTSSCSLYDFVLANTGEPQEFSYVPAMSSLAGDRMTMWERYLNYRISTEARLALEEMFDDELSIYRTHLGAHLSHWRDLLVGASLYMTNSNPYLDFPRPVLQKTVAIGGVSVELSKIPPLTEEWNEVLNRKPKTMLVSFGSMAKSSEMPENYRENLLEVMRSEPDVTFIWKYETDDVKFAEGVPNIYFSKWVPQTSLLIDPRLTAFLTHGGLGSTMELAHCGTPALMVPLAFDQLRNSNMLARHEIAIVLDKKKLGDVTFVREALKSILFDDQYQRNSKRIAGLLKDQPVRATELFVKNTEFVARYGPFPLMDPFSRQLNVFQRHLLDVYATFALATIIIAVALTLLIRKMISKFINVQKKNQ